MTVRPMVFLSTENFQYPIAVLEEECDQEVEYDFRQGKFSTGHIGNSLHNLRK